MRVHRIGQNGDHEADVRARLLRNIPVIGEFCLRSGTFGPNPVEFLNRSAQVVRIRGGDGLGRRRLLFRAWDLTAGRRCASWPSYAQNSANDEEQCEGESAFFHGDLVRCGC
jgi:hypothetical protein